MVEYVQHAEGVQMRSKRADYGIGPKEFAIAWNSSETLDEVAEKTGMPKPIVSARANHYRRMGVPLKKLKRVPAASVDAEDIKETLKQMGLMPGEGSKIDTVASDRVRSMENDALESLVEKIVLKILSQKKK